MSIPFPPTENYIPFSLFISPFFLFFPLSSFFVYIALFPFSFFPQMTSADILPRGYFPIFRTLGKCERKRKKDNDNRKFEVDRRNKCISGKKLGQKDMHEE
jgi:hypothetical protein